MERVEKGGGGEGRGEGGMGGGMTQGKERSGGFVCEKHCKPFPPASVRPPELPPISLLLVIGSGGKVDVGGGEGRKP